MWFGTLDLESVTGAMDGYRLAHSERAGEQRYRKGTPLTPEIVNDLRVNGLASVTAIRLEPGDVDEDVAAARLGALLEGDGITAERASTGRVNLHAEADGLFRVDAGAINTLNRIDPALTVATLAHRARVKTGQMVATVKVIPYAVDGLSLALAEKELRAASPMALHPFSPLRVCLIQTTHTALKHTIHDKTRAITQTRLAALGSTITHELRLPHREKEVSEALAGLDKGAFDLILIFGASAVADPRDVIPQAVRQAAGHVLQVGMPVDPGNLLVLGDLAGVTLIGAPGCARSPRDNGLDLILQRLAARLPVTPAYITGLGVGGLLEEIVTRPQPRNQSAVGGKPSLAGIILAAGSSTRMGSNKLLATYDGVPQVRRIAESALKAGLDEVIVVTGHQSQAISAALEGLDCRFVHNPDHLKGMGTSLATGARAVSEGCAGVMVLLADMPGIDHAAIEKLSNAFDPLSGASLIVASHEGVRGNPVLFDRRFLPELESLDGDTGAKALLEAHKEAVLAVETGNVALLDTDVPVEVENFGGMPSTL